MKQSKKKQEVSSKAVRGKSSKAVKGKSQEEEKITITFVVGDKKRKIKVVKGMSLEEFFQCYHSSKSPIVGGKVNYVLRDLWTRLEEPCLIHPVDLTDFAGVQIYARSLVLLLLRAMEELYPDYHLEVSHSISRGLYCEFYGKTPLRRDMLVKLESRMREIVEKDEHFIRREIPKFIAIKLFQKGNMSDKVKLLENHAGDTVTLYECGKSVDTFYGSIVPRTSYLKHFALTFYPPGLILRFPDQHCPDKVPEFQEQSRLFRVFQEHKKWAKILDVKDIGELNDKIESGEISDLIKVSESIQEKKIAQIADQITKRIDNVRLILIAGPSSSGKTTFAKRLAIHLKINGIKTTPISLDNYFRNREEVPRDENGDYDFEAVEAIDVPLLNEHLHQLFDGLEVVIPHFNFAKGIRTPGKPLKIEPGELLILEGIHALNHNLTPLIPELQKFKIYVSALTVLNVDSHNRIPTTELRIIRRVVRDYSYRSYSALETLHRWPSIRRGEIRYIFPFQNHANVMFNSGMIYELAVLKPYAEPLLQNVPHNAYEYAEARRLLTFLSYFKQVPPDEIPPTSILREFIGKSSFQY